MATAFALAVTYPRAGNLGGRGFTAVDAPRFHHQWQPDVIDHEPFFTSPDSAELLRKEGYTLTSRTLYPNAPESSARTWGDAETILVDPRTGLRQGANDLRSPDSAAVGW